MIHLRTFNLEKIDKIRHYSLLMALDRDKQVQGYISHHLFSWLADQHYSSEDIEVGKAYVLVRENQYVGVVGSLHFSPEGILEVWYAISRHVRKMGYGEKILAEITPHLVENVEGLQDIELRIAHDNLASRRVAELNGYLLVDRDDGVDIYRYFGEKNTSLDDTREGRSK